MNNKKTNYHKITKCRICGNEKLILVLDLGNQALTGVFPSSMETRITAGPLRLVMCMGDNACGLVQLDHSYDLDEMYGTNYGYRSGLNKSMVLHLHNKVNRILEYNVLNENDIIIDIGSNDCTTLLGYPKGKFQLVGIDPTGIKFQQYYPSNIKLIPDFFSGDLVRKVFGDQKAKVVTSFSMFYDLEDPMGFMQDVYDVLMDGGIWVFEQSYMPSMLKMNSYDTVCHEHLEFYSLRQIKWMTDRVGFKILDVEFNDINGGSFSVTAIKTEKNILLSDTIIRTLEDEVNQGLNSLSPYLAFAARVQESKDALLKFVKDVRGENKTVSALGASTKGNVLLQYCDLDANKIEYVGEVNAEKFNCYTPGTLIPIISEDELIKINPDYLIVLPWHFRDFFKSNKKFSGMKLVFPLPRLEILEIP